MPTDERSEFARDHPVLTRSAAVSWRLLVVAAAALAAIALMDRLLAVVVSIAVAGLMTRALWPVRAALKRRGLDRGVSAGAALVLLIGGRPISRNGALVTASNTGALIVAIVVLVVQQLDNNNLLSPVIYGTSLQLHPLVILLGITAGGALFGIVGTLLAVPVLAVGINAVRGYLGVIRPSPPEAPAPP